MDAFCRECLRFGCLKEFVHFSLYLRGREELLVTVHANTVSNTGTPSKFSVPPSPIKMMLLENPADKSFHVPPASPAGHEGEKDENESMFLLGGYARYKCPYVWLRSCSKQMQKKMTMDMDMPLKLNTTEQWKNGGVKAWDMVAEVVRLALKPPPPNPFKIDRLYYDTMADFERCLAAGAMASFLNELYMTSPPYAQDVLDDLQFVLDLHFTTLPTFVLQPTTLSALAGGGSATDTEPESSEYSESGTESSPSTAYSTPTRPSPATTGGTGISPRPPWARPQ